MSGEKPEGKDHDRTTVGFDQFRPYPFPPSHPFEDAVTKMIANYNGRCHERGFPPILPRHAVRVRVYYPKGEQKPPGGFSQLDKLEFDGVSATSSFHGEYEVTTVGAFARRAHDSQGRFLEDREVMLQIACYGSNMVLRDRDTSHLQLSDSSTETVDIGDKERRGLTDMIRKLEGNGQNPPHAE